MDTTDPYEQQLLAVFESCDDYSQNSLSSAGLYQLCEKLQLEDHYHKLLKCVIGESQTGRISFNEFKDGLLKLLNNSECEERNGHSLSPTREVSPKSVFGKKKYGRRSRPDNPHNDNQMPDDVDDSLHVTPSGSTDNDSGSEELVPKKRKTRCNKRNNRNEKETIGGDSKSQEPVLSPINCTVTEEEECLITAWSSVSRGLDNRDELNKDELVKVFQCVGLESGSEEAAQRVFEKLSVDQNGSIRLQELLEFIRSGASWSKDMRNQEIEAEQCQKSASFEYLEPSQVGCVTGAYLIEQWEAAGVPGASHLLHKLGLSENQQVDVASLIALLSDELKILNDDKSPRRNLDPSTALILAISVLQNVHVQSLKSLIEHMNAEKEKLRNDVIEANQRALLLAQEIDDHHSKLEHSTQQQVRSLEQRHAEKIRELTMQLKSEQDVQATQTSILECKVSALEDERNKCKSMITQLEQENKTLEQEHRTVMEQLATMKKIKEKVEVDLATLSNLQQKATEMEAAVNNNEIMSLMERVHALENENTNLRDRNDELSTEVEELSAKLINASIKKRSSPVHSLPMSADESMEESAYVGGGTKRRGESFEMIESAEDSGGEEGSPRLGKVRKCSPVKDFMSTTSSLQGLQIRGIERGENVDDEPTVTRATSAEEEVRLDGSLTQRNISFSQELQQVLEETKNAKVIEEKMRVLEERFLALEGGRAQELMNYVREIVKALRGDDCEGCKKRDIQLKDSEEEIRRTREEFEEKSKELGERCKNLEASLELLKEEYEKTEDYWSEKLEDERTFFEEEQKLSDKKYSELIVKILEYEDLLSAEREQRQRLETIDEKDGFEKQVMDLEQECFELRSQFADAMKSKESEIERLKEEIRMSKSSLNDASVQVTERSSDESCDVDSLLKKNGEESSKKSKSYSRRSFTFSSGDRKTRYCGCCHSSQVSKSSNGDVKSLQESKKQLEKEIEVLINERDLVYKEVMEKRRELNSYVFSSDSVSNKFTKMEDKCHSLMSTLKQQQKQTEEILRNTWRQHKTEVKDLKSVLKLTEEKLKRQTEVIQEQLSKLARTDLLVKDLFVENAYLISSVQKLEQQCQTSKPEDLTA